MGRPANVIRKLPSIDGWRAVAILLVIGYHSPNVDDFPTSFQRVWQGVFDGSLGVRLFFVISGFLITWLLLREKADSGRVSLRQFYVRRGLRILPAYIFLLIILLLLSFFTVFKMSTIEWAAALTFTINFVHMQWILGHLWSLSVEEQFYLLWPFLLSMLHRIPSFSVRAGYVLLFPVLLCPVLRVVAYTKGYPFPLTHLSPLLFADTIAIGCIAAFVFYFHRKAVDRSARMHGTAMNILAVFLIGVPWILQYLRIAGKLTVPFGNTMQATGFAILMLQSIDAEGGVLFQLLTQRGGYCFNC